MMKKNIKQEVFKLSKQGFLLKNSLTLVLFIVAAAAVTKSGQLPLLNPEKMLTTLFNSGWLIVFYMVYLASQIFSLEFRYGTIKNLLQNDGQRSKLFLSKVLTLVGYSIYLNLVALGTTLISALVLFPTITLEEGSLLQSLAANLFSSFIGMWLFASLSLLISLVIKNEAFASMLGIASYFMASMVAGLQFILLDQLTWLRWNPFNMLNLANQLKDSSLANATLLTNQQLVLGNFIYILVFIISAKIIFAKKAI